MIYVPFRNGFERWKICLIRIFVDIYAWWFYDSFWKLYDLLYRLCVRIIYCLWCCRHRAARHNNITFTQNLLLLRSGGYLFEVRSSAMWVGAPPIPRDLFQYPDFFGTKAVEFVITPVFCAAYYRSHTLSFVNY